MFVWGCPTCFVGMGYYCPFHGENRINVPMTTPDTDINLQEMVMEGQTDIQTGIKYDGGKAPLANYLSLWSMTAIIETGKVLEFGGKKYGYFNWKKGLAWLRVLSAVFRHLTAWMMGQDKDPETGLSHLAHAMCGIMFLLEYEETHKELDDRIKLANSTD